MTKETAYIVVEDGDNHFLVEEPAMEYGNPVFTYVDYLRFKIEERLELFRGRIFKMSAPNRSHQSICGHLFNRMYNFLYKQPCKVYIAPFDVRLPVKNKKRDDEITTVVQPDIMVVCDATKLDERGICGAPDLVVEILSPGNSKKEVSNKFDLYEEAGVREYWIVNPEMKTVIIYNLVNDKFIGSRFYTEDDIVKSTVLEGFSMEVKDMFEE
jgi:Uma2 family endonuclease